MRVLGRGDPSELLNTPRSNWWTGLTTDACSRPSAISRLPRPKSAPTPCWTTHPWQHNLMKLAFGNPGAVHNSFGQISCERPERRVNASAAFSSAGASAPNCGIARHSSSGVAASSKNALDWQSMELRLTAGGAIQRVVNHSRCRNGLTRASSATAMVGTPMAANPLLFRHTFD